MAILDRETYLSRISELFPGDDDASLSALEDLRDTYEDLAGRESSGELERLRTENEDLRRRYRERFDNPPAGRSDPDPNRPGDPEPPEDPAEKLTFEDLFEEVGK